MIALIDNQAARMQLVSRVIARCGTSSFHIRSLTDIQKLKASFGSNVAAAGLDVTPQATANTEFIHALGQEGFKVVAYADGSTSWPIAKRCEPLLAGCVRFLDSSATDFSAELHKSFIQLLNIEAERRSEEKSIQVLMKRFGMVGSSEAMISVFRSIVRFGRVSDLPVLISGETGVGKELAARAIHSLDAKRCGGPFIPVNCAAVSPGLAESEFFGHRRGAFTGASDNRQGLIRAAQGGVLFLDEIDELEPHLQSKLLRILQENRVLAVGEEREIAVDVRIVAASNANLNEMVQQKRFRADLFHRLNVLSLHLPALRERSCDIGPLIEHFIQKYQSLTSRTPVTADTDFLDALSEIELPGNVRQLENLVRRALVNKQSDGPLSLSDLPREVWHQLVKPSSPAAPPMPPNLSQRTQDGEPEGDRQDGESFLRTLLDLNAWNLPRSLAHCERALLRIALNRTNGRQSDTARLLGITARSIYNKIHKHSLKV